MATNDILPPPLRRSLTQLGKGINIARRRRRLTAEMMAERIGVGRQTYRRVERGDPSVATGTYLMALFVLGLDWENLGRSADPRMDDVGTGLTIAELPKLVRSRLTRNPE